MRYYLLVLVVSATVTGSLTPICAKLSKKLGIITQFRNRDVHQEPTPKLGGLSILLGCIAAVFVGSFIPYFKGVYISGTSPWLLVLCGIAICLVGGLDDKFEFGATSQFAGQILVSVIIAINGIRLTSLPIFGQTIGSSRLNLIATVFVFLVTMNAINFADGLNGLASGVIGIGSFAFFLYSYFLSTQTKELTGVTYASFACIISAITIGACFGFWIHNFFKPKIFLGDSGALLLGLLFGSATITVAGNVDPGTAANTKLLPSFVPLAIPLVVLCFPLLDMIWTVTRRIIAGTNPFKGDNKHIHYELTALGKSKKRTVLIVYLWTAVISIGCVFFAIFPVYIVAPLLIFVLLICFIFSFSLIKKSRKKVAEHYLRISNETLKQQPTVSPFGNNDKNNQVNTNASEHSNYNSQ